MSTTGWTSRGRGLLVLALDHGHYFGPMPGLESPERIIELAGMAADSGADALIVTYGVTRLLRDRVPLCLITRLDGGATRYTAPSRTSLLYRAAEAKAAGADGVIVMGYVGSEAAEASLVSVARAAAEAREAGLTSVAEMIPLERAAEDPAGVATAVRIGSEYGADFIKAPYTGSEASFRAVVHASLAPVLVLGGSKEDEATLMRSIAEARRAGAAGVAIGRNIWQSRDPRGMLQRLRDCLDAPQGGDADSAATL